MKKTWLLVVASGCLLIAVIFHRHSHHAATTAAELFTDTPAASVARSEPPANSADEKPAPALSTSIAPTPPAQTPNTNTSTELIRLKAAALLTARNQAQKQARLEELRQTRQLDAALAHLRQLAAEQPDDPRIPTTIGQALLKQAQTLAESGDGDHLNEMGILGLQANQSFDAALKIDPQNWEAQFTKAAMMYYWPAELGRDNEVIQRLSTLIDQQEKMPGQADFAQTYVVLGNEYLKVGQRDKAQATWTLGLEKFPNDASLLKKSNGQ
jgi:tetratricopeptide (TPR) repeat protein